MATVTLPERCYTFDVQYPLMVVGTAERHIQIFNLTNPNTAYKVNCSSRSIGFMLTEFRADNHLSAKVANTRRLVLYFFYQ